jgi:hypothetical protein
MRFRLAQRVGRGPYFSIRVINGSENLYELWFNNAVLTKKMLFLANDSDKNE